MGTGRISMPQNGNNTMTEEQELRLFLYVYCKGNVVEAKMAYNFIMGDNVPKGSDFDVDKFRQAIEHMGEE